MSGPTILLVIAVACFLIAATNIPSRINLIAVGLAFWALAELLPHLPAHITL